MATIAIRIVAEKSWPLMKAADDMLDLNDQTPMSLGDLINAPVMPPRV